MFASKSGRQEILALCFVQRKAEPAVYGFQGGGQGLEFYGERSPGVKVNIVVKPVHTDQPAV